MKKLSALSSLAMALAALVLVIAPASRAAETNTTAPANYCTSKGGKVLTRSPFLDTNDAKKDWVRLSGGAQFCAFTAKDGSRLELLLSTLYTTQPTLAALAYYAKEPLDESKCPGGASPGYCYCAQVGGTDSFGGANANGGGWVNKTEPVYTVMDSCIFPDLSSIDAFALAYHSASIVRGKNLVGVLRFPNPYKK